MPRYSNILFYWTQVYLGLDVTYTPFTDLTDVTLAEEDTKSILLVFKNPSNGKIPLRGYPPPHPPTPPPLSGLRPAKKLAEIS